jgi:hypothetical protein
MTDGEGNRVIRIDALPGGENASMFDGHGTWRTDLVSSSANP